MVYDDVYSSMHIYISDFGYTLSTYYNLHQNVNKHNRHKEKSEPSFELCDRNSKG